MTKVSTKFTDSNLKFFYGNVLNHYKECLKNNQFNDVDTIYKEMFLAAQHALESENGTLYHLDREEKDRVYKFFDAIFKALPIYTQLPIVQQHQFNPIRPIHNPRTVYEIHSYNNYNCYDPFLFNWVLLSSMTHHCHHSRVVISSPSGGPVHTHPGSTGKTHTHEDSKNGGGVLALLAGLVIIALAALLAILALVAMFYMFHEFLNSMERFWYGEGWLKAGLMMASMVGFGGASAALTLVFATGALTALAVTAGFPPVTLIIIATVCLTLIGAGIGCLATSLLYGFVDFKLNSDAMDPNDSVRFGLSDEDEVRLIEKHIDPSVVKCAMVALRSEMAQVMESDGPIPSFLGRQFGQGNKVQVLLQRLRELKQGNITVVQVGDLCFDCRRPMIVNLGTTNDINVAEAAQLPT